MKTGKTIQELATEVTAQRGRIRDYRINQSVLEMDSALNIVTPAASGALVIKPRELMHAQLAEKLGIPSRYYDRMRTERPELLRANVNTWFGASSEKRFVRTFEEDGALAGRAFLGNGYKPLDNFDMMEALIPPLMGTGLRAESSEITETKLYMQLVTEKLTAKITPGVHNFLKVPDPVQLGLVVSNSEVGAGALSIQVLVYRLVCTNGLILPADIDLPGFRKVHVGGNLSRDNVAFRDETRRLTDAAIWAQARDLITAAISQTTLDGIVARLSGIAQVKLEDPEKAVELVASRFDLLEDERKGVMANLIAGGDVSQWGLTNAVTALANTAPTYDRAIELETIGGKVATLSGSMFGHN